MKRPVLLGCGLWHPLGDAVLDADLTMPNLSTDVTDADPGRLKSLSAHFPGASLRRLPHYVRMGLFAALQALREAGRFPCPESMGLVAASACGCQKTGFDFMDSILDDGPRLSSPLAFSHSVNNMASGLLSLTLQVRGPGLTVSTGPLSFASALQTALLFLRSGRCDSVLVGAMDEADSRFQAVFPEARLAPAAIFFCLGMAGTGTALSIAWNESGSENAGSEEVALLEMGGTAQEIRGLVGESLDQALGCLLAARRLDACGAGVFRRDPLSGLSARIRLEPMA